MLWAHISQPPYDWYRKNNIDQYEDYYTRVFYAYFTSIGIEVGAEEPTEMQQAG